MQCEPDDKPICAELGVKGLDLFQVMKFIGIERHCVINVKHYSITWKLKRASTRCQDLWTLLSPLSLASDYQFIFKAAGPPHRVDGEKRGG